MVDLKAAMSAGEKVVQKAAQTVDLRADWMVAQKAVLMADLWADKTVGHLVE